MERKIKVIDAFTYFDEWDLLLARLDYLSGVVDGVAISELLQDHSGNVHGRGLTREQKDELYTRYPGLKVGSVLENDTVYGENRWPHMWAQRNALYVPIGDMVAKNEWGDNVLVLLSDVDEFPRAEVVDALREAIEAGDAPLGQVYRFRQRMFYYNCRTVSPNLWSGTVAVGLDPFCRLSPQWARYAPAVDIAPTNGLEAGWHFSYFGGPKKVMEKMGRLCEGWTAGFAIPGHVEKVIAEGGDLYNRAGENWVRLEQPWIDLPPGMEQFYHSGIEPVENPVEGYSFAVDTDNPVAVDSIDHLHPCGAAKDNSRNAAFVYKTMGLFDRNPAVLDIGCAGGGMAADFLKAGCPAVGIEGSSFPLHNHFGEWPLLAGKNLFTVDATKPFRVAMSGEMLRAVGVWASIRFEVITAWEVLEHIYRDDLPQFFANVKAHLSPGGYFICSINSHPHEVEGVQYHVTQMPPEWWSDRIEEAGFCRCPDVEAYFGTDTVRRGHGNFVFRRSDLNLFGLKGDTQ